MYCRQIYLYRPRADPMGLVEPVVMHIKPAVNTKPFMLSAR